jgi:hypothetical protein
VNRGLLLVLAVDEDGVEFLALRGKGFDRPVEEIVDDAVVAGVLLLDVLRDGAQIW